MRNTMLLGLLVALLSACAGPDWGDASGFDGGTAGAAPLALEAPGTDTGEAGIETGSDGGSGPVLEPQSLEGSADRAECRAMLDYQQAGGFWCELDSGAGGAGAVGEFAAVTDPAPCHWCYLARCGADGFTHWVPVECSALPL